MKDLLKGRFLAVLRMTRTSKAQVRKGLVAKRFQSDGFFDTGRLFPRIRNKRFVMPSMWPNCTIIMGHLHTSHLLFAQVAKSCRFDRMESANRHRCGHIVP